MLSLAVVVVVVDGWMDGCSMGCFVVWWVEDQWVGGMVVVVVVVMVGCVDVATCSLRTRDEAGRGGWRTVSSSASFSSETGFFPRAAITRAARSGGVGMEGGGQTQS